MERMITGMLFQPGVIGLFGLIFLLPMIKGLLIHEKKAWLNRLIDDSEDESTKNVLKNTLAKYSNNSNKHSIYQLYKFQLGVTGIALILSGIVTMLIDMKIEIEVLVLLPLIFGAAIFGVYFMLFKNSGVWREIGAGSLFLGFAITFFGIFPVYELEFMRMDLVLFLVLGAGLVLYKFFKSNAVTYIYLMMVLASPMLLPFLMIGEYSAWLSFLMLMPWLFLGAMFYMWMPRLDAAKCIGMVEVAFGVLFALAALSLSYTLSGSISPLVWGVTTPILYIISKRYFNQGHWLISKPIQLIVAASVIYTIILSVDGGFMNGVSARYSFFEGWNIPRTFLYVIVAGIGYAAYLLYDKMDESNSEIDNLILLFPPFYAVVAWFGDWGSSYLILIYGLVLGYSYLTKGLEEKHELFVVLGSYIALSVVLIKLSQFLTYGWFTSAWSVSLFLVILGGVVLALMTYLRSEWSVSNENGDALLAENKSESIISE